MECYPVIGVEVLKTVQFNYTISIKLRLQRHLLLTLFEGFYYLNKRGHQEGRFLEEDEETDKVSVESL